MHDFTQVPFIWHPQPGCEHDYYVNFRAWFELDASSPDDAILEISADTSFAVWLNGRRLPGNNYADYPRQRTFSLLEIPAESLRPGRNLLAVQVYFAGLDSYTVLAGRPYLKARIRQRNRIIIQSDSSWLCCLDRAYAAGRAETLTLQIGCKYRFDARLAEDWQDPNGNTGPDWRQARLLPADEAAWWSDMRPRPVPLMLEAAPPDTRSAGQGLLRRQHDLGLPGKNCYADFLRPLPAAVAFTEDSCRATGNWQQKRPLTFVHDTSAELLFRPCPDEDANGYYLIVDLERESCGYLTFRLTAAAGTCIDMVHGEHLRDGRVCGDMGRYDFGDQFICRDGLNAFTHWHRRYGARYLELHCTATGNTPPAIAFVGLVPVDLPLPTPAEFCCEDRLQLHIRQLAIDTLRLCMHEHYEDCPWREQAMWTYDSRMQMLFGYYVWGNYDYVDAALDLIARSDNGSDYLAKVAPGQASRRPIPSFTLVWPAALHELSLYSGSLAAASRHLPVMDRIIDCALQRTDADGRLYHAGTNPDLWNFYEWSGSLNALDHFPQAPYNIYLYECLQAAADLHQNLGHAKRSQTLRQKARELAQAIDETFWDESKGIYSALRPGEHPHDYEHIQAIMLANNLVPDAKIPRLHQAIQNGRLIPNSFGSFRYLLDALMQGTPDTRRQITDTLNRMFEPVALAGATSLWETFAGANDFSGNGSLCHAWSSITPYACGKYRLGITPLTPGFKTFAVKPYPGELSHAAGTVPTPHGPIRVAWQLSGGALCLQVAHPAALVPVVENYPEIPLAEVHLNPY